MAKSQPKQKGDCTTWSAAVRTPSTTSCRTSPKLLYTGVSIWYYQYFNRVAQYTKVSLTSELGPRKNIRTHGCRVFHGKQQSRWGNLESTFGLDCKSQSETGFETTVTNAETSIQVDMTTAGGKGLVETLLETMEGLICVHALSLPRNITLAIIELGSRDNVGAV